MRIKKLLFVVVAVAIVSMGFLAGRTLKKLGNPDSPSAPANTYSYTLEDIYNRVNDGTEGDTTIFTEPAAGPGTETMHTLNEIYDLIGLRAPVPKTGDTYNDLLCTGEDGELQKGVAWPNPRFTNHGDGTVTDNLTGLMWMQDADAGNDCHGPDTGKETWADALASAAACNAGGGFAGYTDWRLPNVRELLSLVHYGVFWPAVPNTAGTGQWTDGDPFTGVQDKAYWSSTTAATNADRAWYVGMRHGISEHYWKTDSYYVWLVRGGQ